MHGSMGPAALAATGSFWEPVEFSWTILVILVAVCAVLTIGFMVWTALQRDEPDFDTTAEVDRAVRRDLDAAATLRRRLDADTGRADTSEPELR